MWFISALLGLLLKVGSKVCLLHRELLDLQLQPFSTGSRSAELQKWAVVPGWLHHIIPASTDWTQSDYKHPEPPDPLVYHFHCWLLVLFFSWLHTTMQHSGEANLKKTAWTNCNLYMALLSTFLRPTDTSPGSRLGFWLWLVSLAPGDCESCPKMALQHILAWEQRGWEKALKFYFCPFVNDTVWLFPLLY